MNKCIMFLLTAVFALSVSAPAEAANWVQVPSSDKTVEYIDIDALNWRDQNERIVMVVRKVIEPSGYDLVLEQYSLSQNTIQMNAILTFSNDGSVKSWHIIDNKSGFLSCILGDEWKKPHPQADGVKILDFLKDAEKRGLIRWKV